MKTAELKGANNTFFDYKDSRTLIVDPSLSEKEVDELIEEHSQYKTQKSQLLAEAKQQITDSHLRVL